MLYPKPEWTSHAPDATAPKLLGSYQRAAKADVTPYSLDREAGTAEFVGRHGHYFTSLFDCPCGSHPKPCKHMYRLAMELGLMDAELESDHAKISNRMGAYSTGLNSDNIREILDALDEDGQRLMLDIAVGLDGLAGSNRRALVRTLSVEHLLSLGLLSDYPLDFSDAGISFRKGDIRAALVSAGISVPDDRLKKGSRQEKDRQYLAALQQSDPAPLENLFAVVDGTALAYDRRNVIFSYLSKNLTEE